MPATMAKVYAALEKQYADILFDPTRPRSYPSIPTGSFMLDYATGIGGLPRGRITELYGLESTGKTTVAMHVIKNAQDMGLGGLYIDHEGAVDFQYGRSIGVDFSKERFILIQPKTLEQGMTLARQIMDMDLLGVIVVDSMAAMNPEKQFESDTVGDQGGIGLLARALSIALAQTIPSITHSQVAFVFINQMRERLNLTGPLRGRSMRTTPGGHAPKFYSSMRIEFRVIEALKGKVRDLTTGKWEDGYVGSHVEAKVTKNKLAPPFGKARFMIRYGKGIDHELSLLAVAESRGLVEKRSAGYYRFPPLGEFSQTQEIPSIQGMQSAANFLKEHPLLSVSLLEEVKKEIDKEISAPTIETVVEGTESEYEEEFLEEHDK